MKQMTVDIKKVKNCYIFVSSSTLPKDFTDKYDGNRTYRKYLFGEIGIALPTWSYLIPIPLLVGVFEILKAFSSYYNVDM